MEGIITVTFAAISPYLIKKSTDVVKKYQAIEKSNQRVLLIRMIVAILAVVGSVLTAIIGEGVFDPTLLEGALIAIFNFVVATALYYGDKLGK